MEETKQEYLPFIIRDMLKYGKPAKLEIRITSFARLSTRFNVRVLTRHGWSEYSHPNTGDSAEQAETFQIPDIPIFVMIENAASADIQGQAYLMAHLIFDGEATLQLCAGDVYGRKSINYPMTQNPDMRPSGGEIRTVTSADPAAGSQISLSVTTGEIWKILSMRATFVTDATVATRFPHMIFDSGGGMIIDALSSTGQTASQTINYSVSKAPFMVDAADDNDITIPLPEDIYVLSGGTIDTSVTNMQAGDNWGTLKVMVQRFFHTVI